MATQTAAAQTHVHMFPGNPGLPPDVIDQVVHSPDRLGLLTAEGHIATLSTRLAFDLGFEGPTDLSGLPVFSLWQHADRPEVEQAFAAALTGNPAWVRFDLGYIAPISYPAKVTFAPNVHQDTVLMTVDWQGSDIVG
ncbi:hypothetical protein [Jannaschia sp. 2305UL9-9]|uniref:hypothetical protein n=1 Tax=Jannaschia sp. 2305UL9-9 TaxID=3121638 RepID=UPI0035282BAF